VYRALPPKPRDGYWMGYYIEIYFPSDTEEPPLSGMFRNNFIESTAGYVWPNTFPFDDCHGDDCWGKLV